MSPKCSLPEHLNDPEEIENAFPDDSQFKGFFGNLWKRWNKMTKTWDAWGPRCPKGIAFSLWPPWILARKWRENPIVLIARKGNGWWRVENDESGDNFVNDLKDIPKGWYLSRNQYWCRWHWQIAWPLFFCFHKYDDTTQVMAAGTRENKDNQLTLGYIGAKRDADKVFWYVAAFFGRCFK
jgi:hypothetical protein